MDLSWSNPGTDRLITAKHVARLIPELNRGASPGPDGVTAEQLVYGSSPELLRTFAALLAACLDEM